MGNISPRILCRKEHFSAAFVGHFLKVLQKKSTDLFPAFWKAALEVL
jgi:hypothetical protein